MKALLIPVKHSANAKQRLAAHFSATARADLATAFWKDFFDVVAQSRGFDAVFVVSSNASALERARYFGWQTIVECEQHFESESVDFASAECERKGITALLRMPIDLPVVAPHDIELVFAQTPAAPGALIVPSADGDGTNALLRTPPSLFRSHFGPSSFRKHLAASEVSGAKIITLRNPRIEVDVDTIDDVRRLNFENVRGVNTRRWVEKYLRAQSSNISRVVARA